MAQCRDGAGRFAVGINHVFGQCANDAVTAGIHIGDFVAIRARGFDNPACTRINYGGNAT